MQRVIISTGIFSARGIRAINILYIRSIHRNPASEDGKAILQKLKTQ